MSTIGSYPVSNFSPTQYFLVYEPSSQTLKRVLGSELVTAINGDAVYVRAVSTRAVAQTLDLEIGVILQTGGGTVAGDGGSGAFLVVATGEGDFVMNNGNELLALPRGSLAGSDLDGALVTDNGTVREIQDAITSRPVEFESFAAIMLEDLSGYNYAATTGFYGGWAATVAGPKGGATYHRDGTTGTASTAYSDNSGFYDANGDGFRLAPGVPLNFHQFGAIADGVGAAGRDNTYVQYGLTYVLNNGGVLEPLVGEYQVSSLTYKPTGDQYTLNMRCKGRLRPGEPENNLAISRTRGVIFHFESISGSSIGFDIGDGTNNPQGIYIENLYLLGQTSQNTASPTDTTTGLKLTLCPESVLKNVVGSKFHTPMSYVNCWSTSLYDCAGTRCYYPINFGASCNNFRTYNWRSWDAYWAGTITGVSAGITMSAPWFEVLTNGLLINNGANEVNGVTLVNPHCESITNYCFELGYDAAGSQTAGNIQSFIVIGGYYNSVGTGVSNAKMRISDATSRDVALVGEMGNFSEDQIDGNYTPVVFLRSEKTDNIEAGGPYKQEFYGSLSGAADATATDIFTIQLPTGDCMFDIDVRVVCQTTLGSQSAVTRGTISAGRKSGEANCYATYSETVAKVAADNGAGQTYSGAVAISITTSTDTITVKVSADNNQSATNNIHYYANSIGGERSQGAVRKLIYTAA